MLRDIIARLEKATGPDRKLDGDIAKAVGAEHGPREYVHIESRSYSVFDEIAPHYTASIDAALTLVPDGCVWACGYSRLVPHNAKVYVEGRGAFIGECDSNRAVALCIAALNAVGDRTDGARE